MGSFRKKHDARFTPTHVWVEVCCAVACWSRLPVSGLCNEQSIHPTRFYHWQKQLFENGAKGRISSSTIEVARKAHIVLSVPCNIYALSVYLDHDIHTTNSTGAVRGTFSRAFSEH